MRDKKDQTILWFREINHQDIPFVGGKSSSLGEMFSRLDQLGISLPNGFALTTKAYQFFIQENRLQKLIEELRGTDDLSKEKLSALSIKIQAAFLKSQLPLSLKTDIKSAYEQLASLSKTELSVAVRSSATAEDLPEASFAGLHESFLNITSLEQLYDKCIECFASLYTQRAVSYRQDKKIDQTKVYLSVAVQVMIRSDLACSGVLFTIDTETGFKDAVVINASYGLGENIVKGVVNPDDIIVFKPTLRTGYLPIIEKKLGGKEFKLVYQSQYENNSPKFSQNETLINVPTTMLEQQSFCLSENEIIQLSRWGILIEEHYSAIRGKHCPMDIEWAKDGINGRLYILQARPETVHSLKTISTVDVYKLKEQSKILLTGDSVGNLIGQGKVRIIKSLSDLKYFKEGDVLVAEKTEPDWEPFLKKSAAIITDRGGRTCHAAIVSRELGIPAVVGTKYGTKILKNDQEVTVACLFGSQCNVYEGLLPFEKSTISLKDPKKTKTKIMMNLANPSMAFKSSLIPNDGVGLLRMEFIITHSIKIHPLALVHFDELIDQELKNKIEVQSRGFNSKKQFYVDQLARGIGMIAAAFYPKKVIIRLSDFKSDEYKSLLGGELFEEDEDNPMLGFRGAFRYYHDSFKEAFELELKAILKVREVMGLVNLCVMVPFCRTLDEGKKVLSEIADHGLKKGAGGLEIYVMCEIPSNALLAEEFAELFDGFSIGSNDLTQLTLGIDRNSSKLAPLFREDDPAVLKLIEMAIVGAHKKGIKIGICGQRPSDDPEFIKFLMSKGIDSLSLNPDSCLKMAEIVSLIESQSLGMNRPLLDV